MGKASLASLYILIDHHDEGLFRSSACPANHLCFKENSSELCGSITRNLSLGDFITEILVPKAGD